jgi:hypothetical protein
MRANAHVRYASLKPADLGRLTLMQSLRCLSLGHDPAGAATGAVAGLTEDGVREEDAHVYSEGVRRGGTLVSVRVGALNRHSPVAKLTEGRYDPQARGYTHNKMLAERPLPNCQLQNARHLEPRVSSVPIGSKHGNGAPKGFGGEAARVFSKDREPAKSRR